MRLDKVLEMAVPLVERQIQSAYADLQNYYEVNWQEIDRQVTGQFKRLFDAGVSAQQDGKGPISCLCVSYLRSSLVVGSGEFCLSLYDGGLYFDETPVHIYWSPVFLWDQFYKDMDIIKKALMKLKIRLKKYEQDAVEAEYAGHFYEIGHKMFMDYSDRIITEMESSALKTTPDFVMTYGGYLDVAAIIWDGGEA